MQQNLDLSSGDPRVFSIRIAKIRGVHRGGELPMEFVTGSLGDVNYAAWLENWLQEREPSHVIKCHGCTFIISALFSSNTQPVIRLGVVSAEGKVKWINTAARNVRIGAKRMGIEYEGTGRIHTVVRAVRVAMAQVDRTTGLLRSFDSPAVTDVVKRDPYETSDKIEETVDVNGARWFHLP